MRAYRLFAAIIFIILFSSLASANKRDIEEADVIVWHRKLVTLRATLDNRNPQQRAADSSKRIQAILSELPELKIKAVSVQTNEWKGIVIMGGSTVMFRIVPDDLPPDGSQTLEQTTNNALKNINDLITEYKKQRSWPMMLRAIGMTILGTIILLVALWLLRRIIRWTLRRTNLIIDMIPTEWKLFVADPRPTLQFVCRRAINLIGAILAFFCVYLWLTFVLTRFPYTHPLGSKLGLFLWTTISGLFMSALAEIPDLLTLIIIFFIAKYGTKWASSWFHATEDGKITISWLDPDTAKATRRLLVIAIWLGAIIVAYPYIPGAGTEAFKGVSVFVGLMLSLGSAGIVHQMMSGLVVIYSRAIKPGDRISVDSTRGKVIELGLLATKIMSPYDEVITIPNAVMVGTSIKNFSSNIKDNGAVIHVTVFIGYEVPWRQVNALLLLAADRTEGVRKTPPPIIFHCALHQHSIEYEICANVEKLDEKIKTISRLNAQILDAFNEYGVQIMVPDYEGQPNEPLVVPKTKWFELPFQS